MTRIKTSTIIVITLATVLMLASPHATVGQQTPSSQWVIVPGQGWGPIRLGMTEQEVYAILGSPQRAAGSPNSRTVWFQDVLMHFDSAAQLRSFALYSPAWKTPEGIHVGSPLWSLLAAYGDSTNPQAPGHNTSCLSIDATYVKVEQQEPPGPHFLDFNYRARGVTFGFSYLAGTRGKPLSYPTVSYISVEKPMLDDCR
jgi:hypothetical protein